MVSPVLIRDLTTAAALRVAGAMLAMLLGACTHGEPWRVEQTTLSPPVAVGVAQRLTFNAEGDWAPAWLPQGNGIGFSWRVPGRADHDRCLAILPLSGRRIDRLPCPEGPRDPTNAGFPPALSAGGQGACLVAH